MYLTVRSLITYMLLASTIVLMACGQKGPLILPDETAHEVVRDDTTEEATETVAEDPADTDATDTSDTPDT